MSEKENKPEDTSDSILISAAKTIGKAAGTIANVVRGGTKAKAKESSSGKKGKKLAKKNKTRLPRKAKKALKKKQQQSTS